MTPDEPDREHRDAIARSRKRWDFWSSHWGLIEQDTVDIRREAVAQVTLEPGDTVLDLGCGPGVNFEMLRDAVGADGEIVGVDLSRKMLDRARDRVVDHGWNNVTLVQADATRPIVKDERFDGAVATTAVSATPSVRSTIENVHHALRPGSRFGLYEIRLVPAGPGRVLNPLVRTFYRRFGNWNADEDVFEELRRSFDRTEIVRTFALGTNYVAVAEKAEP
ncbi:MAG TPA: class I SAM-dependent methyltransferase [Natrialbaceae archaeon]|nr:class I SAM-dependent methyltransferase [Natrialbaceae archaeon]